MPNVSTPNQRLSVCCWLQSQNKSFFTWLDCFEQPCIVLLCFCRFDAVNGLLVPGGSGNLTKGHPFYDNTEYLLKLAIEANDNGDYFPVSVRFEIAAVSLHGMSWLYLHGVSLICCPGTLCLDLPRSSHLLHMHIIKSNVTSCGHLFPLFREQANVFQHKPRWMQLIGLQLSLNRHADLWYNMKHQTS